MAVRVAVAPGNVGVTGCGKLMVCVPYPVPLSEIVWVVPVTFRLLSFAVVVPDAAPTAEGVNTMPSEQVPTDASVVVEVQLVVPLSRLNGAVVASPASVRGVVPSFSSVNTSGALALPRFVLKTAADAVRFSVMMLEAVAIKKVPSPGIQTLLNPDVLVTATEAEKLPAARRTRVP